MTGSAVPDLTPEQQRLLDDIIAEHTHPRQKPDRLAVTAVQQELLAPKLTTQERIAIEGRFIQCMGEYLETPKRSFDPLPDLVLRQAGFDRGLRSAAYVKFERGPQWQLFGVGG